MKRAGTVGTIQDALRKKDRIVYLVYVEFQNATIWAESIEYKETSRPLPIGIRVEVEYFETRSGKPMVEIVDNDLIPVKKRIFQRLFPTRKESD